jgi:hypothetical protein
VAVGGLLFFTWVLLMLWGARGKSAITDSAPAYIFAGSTLGLAVVLYLAYASFFVLHEVCPLCVATYVAVIGVFVISGGASSVPMSSLPSRFLRDMRVLVATPLALVVALLFIAGASWGMTVFPRETERPGRRTGAAADDPADSELARWWDLQPKAELPLRQQRRQGARSSSSPTSSARTASRCTSASSRSRQVPAEPEGRHVHLQDLAAQFRLQPDAPGANFVASCDASALYSWRSARARRRAEGLVLPAPGRAEPDTVKQAAKDVGKIPDFQGGFDKAIQEVKTDAAVGSSLDVHSTPTFFINGRALPGGGHRAAVLRRVDPAGALSSQVSRGVRGPRG